jgi:hypothetical protein
MPLLPSRGKITTFFGLSLFLLSSSLSLLCGRLSSCRSLVGTYNSGHLMVTIRLDVGGME